MAIIDPTSFLDPNNIETLPDILKKNYGINPVPTYNATRCSDRKSGGEDCTVCYDVCPMNIYPEGKRKRPDWTQCIKCGICAANCPDRCITPPASRADNFLMAVSKSGETTVCCSEDETPFSLSLTCIAALSWEQMAYAALGEGLVISLKACDRCDRENYKKLIEENLAQLRYFLGDELYEKKVRILREGDVYRPVNTGMSRRDLFNVFRNLPLDKASRSLPVMESRSEAGLFYRAMLRDRIAENAEKLEPAERPKFRVKLPVFNEKCYNCGSCQRLCPQKALKLINDGDRILVAIDVWRCTSCGICMNTCKSEAISSISPMKISSFGKVAIKKIKAYPCEDCGKPRQKDAEENCCSLCLSRRKSARARAERDAKRAAEKAAKEAEEAAKAAEEAAEVSAEAAAEAAAPDVPAEG